MSDRHFPEFGPDVAVGEFSSQGWLLLVLLLFYYYSMTTICITIMTTITRLSVTQIVG